LHTSDAIQSARSLLKGRSLLKMSDLSAGELRTVLLQAGRLKRASAEGKLTPILEGRTLALIFEKPSLRTRVTFEVAMTRLGGRSIYLAPADIQLGKRESVEDVSRSLSRWVDGIAARTFAHDTVVRLADSGSIPVVNALSDLEHPCQALADLLTIAEHRCGTTEDPDFSAVRLAFVGDGNNVANSLLVASATVGMSMTLARPEGYGPDEGALREALTLAEGTGARIQVTDDPREAVRDADVVYTDVWTSMGQEEERETRLQAFRGWCVTPELMQLAKPDAIVMHCLPAHRGEEIAAEVIDGPQSVVFDQAENRLHAQMGLLSFLL
jgi:ornithine carbamoyltransferase